MNVLIKYLSLGIYYVDDVSEMTEVSHQVTMMI